MTAVPETRPRGGDWKRAVDVVYLAACSRDARLTRICVASIRYFYPDVPIRILAGDILQSGLAEELKTHWNVDVADLPVGDYGWGLVKLEPLFAPAGQRFMVCDVDTVFTGPILDVRAESDAPFFVDDEDLPDADFKRLYYDWEALAPLDPEVQSARRAFNVGQWFGTAGLVERSAFDRWVEWTLPRRLRYPNLFMGGDQGIMNYVVLKKEALEGLRIDRATFMRWPANGMDDLAPEHVAAGTAPTRVVHWAGMKAVFHRNVVGHRLLDFFEDYYYSRMPGGVLRRWRDMARHVAIHWWFLGTRPFRLRWRRLFGDGSRRRGPAPIVRHDIGA